MSLIYNKNNNGPSINPCGTPHFILLDNEQKHYIQHIGTYWINNYGSILGAILGSHNVQV